MLAHLNNTGRLPDLLHPGATGFCLRGKWRKTTLRLFAIGEGKTASLIDTRMQMGAFERAMDLGAIPWLSRYRVGKRNVRLGSSIIDYLLADRGEAYAEIKSAAMLVGNTAMYPDCPSPRARKQIKSLIREAGRGKKSFIIFIAAAPHAKSFRPNRQADPEIYELLKKAKMAGVSLRAIGIRYPPENGLVELHHPDLPIIL